MKEGTDLVFINYEVFVFSIDRTEYEKEIMELKESVQKLTLERDSHSRKSEIQSSFSAVVVLVGDYHSITVLGKVASSSFAKEY